MRKTFHSPSVVVCVLALVVLSAVAAMAQNPSTSGALLTINGTVTDGTNSTPVNVSIYDKDILSGTTQTVPVASDTNPASTCTLADQVPTQGYVLQAAAPTGCDPGDIFEGTLSASDGLATLSGDGYSFNIRTHYQCGQNNGSCDFGTTMTNTNGTVMSGDSGFLTVTNNGPSNSYFVGTITLAGTPGTAAAAGTGCSPGQSLRDSLTYTSKSPFLGPGSDSSGQSVVLALGSVLASDSSGCGGFNVYSQTGQQMNPGSPDNLSQSFPFANGNATFDFDFTTAFNTNDPFTVVSDTVPTITLQGISQATYAAMVAGTSQATTQCLAVPALGNDNQGNPLCGQFTITCTNASSQAPMGDNCPQSTLRNLLIHEQLQISGDASIPAGTAPTMAEGSDTWSPGNCTLVGPEAGNLCPQSELTQLQVTAPDCSCKGGGTGTTLNSSFVFGNGQPEWNTTPTVPAWSNSTTVPVSFTANPPTQAATNNWVASPNKSITFGEENLGATPDTTFPVATDQIMPNPTACPSSWPAPGTVPPTFTTNGSVTVGGPGVYEVHFFSTACDNQEELAFPGTVGSTSPLNQNLATFKTVSFGVDETAPTISTPVLNGGLNTFGPGTNVTASFTCTDDRSGIAGCGNNALPLPLNPAPVQNGQPPASTRLGPTAGSLTQNVTNYPVPTTTLGPETLTVYATDLAGNQSSARVNYTVGFCVVSMDTSGIAGFTSPVLNPGTGALPNINSASVSQAIPMQLMVTDCFGNPITNLNLTSSGGTVVLTAANANICKVDTADNTISTSAAGNSGWQNLGGGSYQYNWKPAPPKGACLSFNVNLGDGILHTAYFQFH